MTFVSYAQNFEDLMLWRALKHVENGFYIDVGAQDPVHDSVSLGFYEKGWRGVHVEASAAYAQKLRQARPDETIIEIALDRQEGEIIFYEIPTTGLSTGDKSIAEMHAAAGHVVEQKAMKSIPLSVVLEEYTKRDVHWLKIDVEGMEEAAIDGWPPSEVRPWIVAVESTLPNSQELCHQDWEPKLLALGYDFVYFDGLNRFYVSHAHPELKASFGLPPNFFDDYVLASTLALANAASIEKEANNVLRQDLERETAARISVEAEAASQQINVEHLAFQLDALHQAQVQRLTEIQQLTLERDHRSMELGHLKDEIDALTHAQAQHLRELQELIVERDRLSIETDYLRQKAEKTAEVQNQYFADIEELAAERDRLFARVEALEKQCASLIQVEGRRLNQIRKLVRDRNQFCAEIELLKSQTEALTHAHRVRLHEMWLESVAFRGQLSDVHGSTSWRLTGPLRNVSKRLWREGKTKRGRVSARDSIKGWVQSRPSTKRTLVRILGRFPELDNGVRRLFSQVTLKSAGEGRLSYVPDTAPRLSRRTRELMRQADAKQTR